MAMRIDILTLFPEMFGPVLGSSIIGRAIAAAVVEVQVTDIRQYSADRHRKVDDAPFGGGPGMVMMCQPVFDAVESVRAQASPPGHIVLLSPQGQRLDQQMAERLSREQRLILVAGHYEGFDERIRLALADVEVSLGDFVLSGGEIPAMAVLDAVVRLQPGAVGTPESVKDDSFSMGLLEYPQYTRPREFRGMGVPDVLLNGHHAEIMAWRAEQAAERTKRRRPDLWEAHSRQERQAGPEPDASGNRPGEKP